ncbi:hypothetical protein ACU4HD_27375 [Cupriavidus basilensis]
MLPEEDVGLAQRFDIGLLATRLEGITCAVSGMAQLGHLRRGVLSVRVPVRRLRSEAAAMTGGRYRIDAVVSARRPPGSCWP